jgi:5-methylcytosine-specific restriction endonuclease McrA
MRRLADQALARLKADAKERRVMAETAFWTIPPDNATQNEIRGAVWDISMGRCHYCTRLMNPFRDFTIDHVVPQSQDGDNHLHNYVASCRSCNCSKGGRRPEEWMPEYDDPFAEEDDA